MSRPAFTPGPWRVEAGDSVVGIYSPAGRVAVTNTKTFYQRHDDRDVANARLMAASPDMFDALQEAREQVAILQARLGITDEGHGTLSIIDAALARASAADAEREYVRAAR